MEKELERLKKKYEELELKRERNINRYILPLESRLERLRERIDKIELC